MEGEFEFGKKIFHFEPNYVDDADPVLVIDDEIIPNVLVGAEDDLDRNQDRGVNNEQNGVDAVASLLAIEEEIIPEQSLTLERINKSNYDKNVPIKRTVHGDEEDVEGDEVECVNGDDDDTADAEKEEDKNTDVILPLEEDAVDAKTVRQSNEYMAKKTVAQGMMDIALITANANQLRYIIAYNRKSSTYFINLVLVSLSLFLQVAVGMCLILKGRLDLKGRSDKQQAKRLNNYVVIGVFLVTVINVFIASFTDTNTTPETVTV